MKNLCFLTLVFIFTISCRNNQYNVDSNGVIEFIHGGNVTTHIDRPLVISTKKIYDKLTGFDSINVKSTLGINNINQQDIDKYNSFYYNRIVTDNITYSTVTEFIINSTDYYESNPSKRIDGVTLHVYINDMEYRINPEKQKNLYID